MIKRRRYVIGFSILIIFLSAFLDVNAQLSRFKAIGSFEDSLPSFWMKGKTTGATLSWATDQSRSMGHSLKITKTAATTDSVYWISQNMADLWSPQLLKNVDILLGAYIRTENVNVNPANDDAKWWVSYMFYDSTGAFIGETKLPIDQTKASSGGWVADTNAVGETILPKDAWKMIIKFVAGKNATGTVWADDFLFTGRAGKWAGQDWNTSVGVPTGWYYWLPPIGGNDARLENGFQYTKVVTDTAHTGTHSLRFMIPKNTPNHDGFVSTTRIPLGTDVKPGDKIKISVWIKAKDLQPDSANTYPGQWAVGITPMFHTAYTNNAGFSDMTGAPDLTFTFPAKDTAFDWRQYAVDVPVPEPQNNLPAKAISVRLHVYSLFEGTVYFDDLTVQTSKTTSVQRKSFVADNYSLEQNYPNPFNPTTTIRYSIPERSVVTLKIYDMLGREVKTLINTEQNRGVYEVIWNGENSYGTKVSSGIYIYRVEAGRFNQVKKMVLLK